jgi:hypothetical protein
MDLSKHMLFQSVRLVGAVGIVWRSAAEPISSFIHTRELRLRIVLVNLLMIPRDYSQVFRPKRVTPHRH